MYKIIITQTNHCTGTVKKYYPRNRYKTLRGAEKAAQRTRSVCMPDGKTITETVDADVVEVRHA
ncbi:hypothetical protein ID850_18910 [Xenorhabdus sp. Flor]|uniref:hypothetical protein n=1 Tax=Xenorhabdus cabanillasii TaxID=351673 RepID=UPI0019C720F0|nr:hypothetical protein [Xenorhabdus sp. Flor]MBD2816744.1 hypothetical protein [Xenorhabdus sp. Flor]